MSSIHSDKGWLVISFMLWREDKRQHVRLYPGIKDTRDNRRSAALKQIREMIQLRQWAALAEKFPRCKALTPFLAPAVDVTSFADASRRFLAHQANVNKAATVLFYTNILKAHLWPVDGFADKPLRLIGVSDVAAAYSAVAAKGHQAQAANVRRTISAVFNWARGERGVDGEYLVDDNPVSRTRPVVVDENVEDIDPFTVDEAKAIVAAAREGWERRVVIVALGSGLEPGENFGLKRKDLNFEKAKIQVSRRYTRFGEGAVKNRRRRREVDMSEPVSTALREQVRQVGLSSPWLWPVSIADANPHNPQNFSRRNWKAILQRAGVKHREFYQCRHTFATLLLRSGDTAWQYIADQMGHANLTMLQEHYWKWRPGSVPKPKAI